MIPKKIHRVWLKDSPPISDKYENYWNAFKSIYPGWELITWDGTEFSWDLQEAFESAPNPGAASDIIRIEILYREGGLYVDVDVEPLAYPESLLSMFDCVCFKQNAGCSNAIISAPKESDTLKAAMGFLKMDNTIKQIKNTPKNRTMFVTGPELVSRVFCSHREANTISQDIWKEYFYHDQAGLWHRDLPKVERAGCEGCKRNKK